MGINHIIVHLVDGISWLVTINFVFRFYLNKKEKEKKCIWVKVIFSVNFSSYFIGSYSCLFCWCTNNYVCISPQTLKLVTPVRASPRKTRKSTNKGESNTECGATMSDRVGTSQVKFRLCSAIYPFAMLSPTGQLYFLHSLCFFVSGSFD